MPAAIAPECTPAAKVTAATAKAAKVTAAANVAEAAAAAAERRFRSAQAQAKAEHQGTQERAKVVQQTFRWRRQSNRAGKLLKRALAQNSALNATRQLGTPP
jgi:hypothetical protein